MKMTAYIMIIAAGITVAGGVRAQETKSPTDSLFASYRLMTSLQPSTFEFTFTRHIGIPTKNPEQDDVDRYRKHSSLIYQLPNRKNAGIYFQLACSLWELGKISDAKKMFLNIVNSQDNLYTTTYYHSSDIPGDTTSNVYGYGSFTSNYKNTACLYLTYICIEQKKFEAALGYLEKAVKKYKVNYTCGTGYNMQKNKYNALYTACYQGLNRHSALLNLLLPEFLDWDHEILTSAIRKLYSPQQVARYLAEAERSIRCEVDSFRSMSVSFTSDEQSGETADTSWYYSGTGTIRLFGTRVTLPKPSLENGERITKNHYIRMFKRSAFYRDLRGVKHVSS